MEIQKLNNLNTRILNLINEEAKNQNVRSIEKIKSKIINSDNKTKETIFNDLMELRKIGERDLSSYMKYLEIREVQKPK